MFYTIKTTYENEVCIGIRRLIFCNSPADLIANSEALQKTDIQIHPHIHL